MSKEVKLRLPYPPSVNTYWKPGHGYIYLSREGREYREKVTKIVKQQFGEDWEPMYGRLSIDVHAVMPDRRKRDLDNIQKAIGDALEWAVVYVDDSQVDEWHITRGDVTPPGHIDIVVHEQDGD